VHGARLEELLRQQAAQPLRGAAHGGRQLHGCPGRRTFTCVRRPHTVRDRSVRDTYIQVR
jgi:hypothetical protein